MFLAKRKQLESKKENRRKEETDHVEICKVKRERVRARNFMLKHYTNKQMYYNYIQMKYV